MLWTSGGSLSEEMHSITAVNIILDTYTSLKKLNHLRIFPNASNLLKKKNHKMQLIGEKRKGIGLYHKLQIDVKF